jgi:osmoprotectant transport system permease protein
VGQSAQARGHQPRDRNCSNDLKTVKLKEKYGISLLGDLGFENAYALVMPRKRAEELGIRTIADLAPRASRLSIAGDYEFFSRPEWAAIRQAYNLSFREQRQMQPDFMYAAIASGEVDVIAGYTSDGLIAKYDLVVTGRSEVRDPAL